MFPERIETERLLRRRLGAADLDSYYSRIYADADVMRTLPGGKPLSRADFEPRSQANLVAPWDKHGFGPWIVERKSDARLLGHCGLRYWPESQDVEVLYAIERPSWGCGFATEAARSSIQAGFEVLVAWTDLSLACCPRILPPCECFRSWVCGAGRSASWPGYAPSCMSCSTAESIGV